MKYNMVNKKICKSSLITIASNKRVYYDYFIEEEIEAGLVLQSWEVKSIRMRKVTISNSYISLKNSEAFLVGASCTPLASTTHYLCDPIRNRKLLLNKNELNLLYNRINRHGYTVITISLYWNNTRCKLKIGIARGKKQHDKRFTLKEREWQQNKARIIKNTNIKIYI